MTQSPEMPERIIVREDYDGDVDGQWLDASAPRPHSFGHYFTEYRRADLPPTPAEAMRCPEVAALVEALAEIAEVPCAQSRAVDGAKRARHLARAALALLQKEG